MDILYSILLFCCCDVGWNNLFLAIIDDTGEQLVALSGRAGGILVAEQCQILQKNASALPFWRQFKDPLASMVLRTRRRVMADVIDGLGGVELLGLLSGRLNHEVVLGIVLTIHLSGLGLSRGGQGRVGLKINGYCWTCRWKFTEFNTASFIDIVQIKLSLFLFFKLIITPFRTNLGKCK